MATAFAATSEDVASRGFLQCGVSTGIPGFSSVDEKGNWSGLDVDICRAVAAAVLGNAEEVKFSPLVENESYTALLSGEVDILARNSTWTFSRDSALAVNFAGISYYDGQGLLIAGKTKVAGLGDLKKVKLCSQVHSGLEDNLIDYFTRNKIEFKKVEFATGDLAVKGFEEGRCDALTMQQSRLYGIRLGLADPEKSKVLPDVISKEPLGPVVRQGDDTWFDIVKWSLFVMIGAEELGINSGNVDGMKMSNRLAVKRLLGLEGDMGKGLGLKRDWAYQIIRQVGNYGEVFERNLGASSLLKVDRGLNRLWNDGGLQYCPPFR
ncbi:amino acid ABC transporter substrate-binding protein [Desulfomarina sp.]